MSRHAFANDALHAAHADTELILQQFADGTHAAIAEMVNIVFDAGIAHQIERVLDSGNYIGDTKDSIVVNIERRRAEN